MQCQAGGLRCSSTFSLVRGPQASRYQYPQKDTAQGPLLNRTMPNVLPGSLQHPAAVRTVIHELSSLASLMTSQMPGDKIHVRWVQTLQLKVHISSETSISCKHSTGIGARLFVDERPNYVLHTQKRPKLWLPYSSYSSITVPSKPVQFTNQGSFSP